MPDELKLISGNSNKPLSEKISQYLNIPLSRAEVTRFSDGEIRVKIDENIRGTDLFIIHFTGALSRIVSNKRIQQTPFLE